MPEEAEAGRLRYGYTGSRLDERTMRLPKNSNKIMHKSSVEPWHSRAVVQQKYHRWVIKDNPRKHGEAPEALERSQYAIVPRTCPSLFAPVLHKIDC